MFIKYEVEMIKNVNEKIAKVERIQFECCVFCRFRIKLLLQLVFCHLFYLFLFFCETYESYQIIWIGLNQTRLILLKPEWNQTLY